MKYYEIDFLPVGTSKSGDAICIRYKIDDEVFVHVVDGGYQNTGPEIVEHINKRYGTTYIDHVIATHPDGDHAGGLRSILNDFTVGTLWMNRPWQYAEELLPRFETYSNVDRLRSRLRSLFPHLAALEDIAEEKKITIKDAFQGTKIGQFTVMAPAKETFLDLVVDSERTPEPTKDAASFVDGLTKMLKEAATLIRAAWGEETFPSDDTGTENAMSIVQFAEMKDKKILLTGDVGRAGLDEAADYAPKIGLALPGLDRFQIPHHGSRHNVSTDTLDRWLGPKLNDKPDKGSFSALASAAKDSETHPRNSVVRAVIHRGGNVAVTKGKIVWYHCKDAPERADFSALSPLSYPEEQEE